MFAPVKVRLVSRRNLDKADVESVYAELIKVIGGTYYASGVAQGPANGTIDWRNLSPNAGITNAQKVSPSSVLAFQLDVPAITNQTFTSKLALPVPSVVPSFATATSSSAPTDFYYLGMTATCDTLGSATNTGSIVVSGAAAHTVNWTNAVVTRPLLANSLLGSPVRLVGTTITIAVTSSVAMTTGKIHLWMKAPHVQ